MKKFLFLSLLLSFPLIARDKNCNRDSLNIFDSEKVKESIGLKVKRLEIRLKIIDFIKSGLPDSLVNISDDIMTLHLNLQAIHEKFLSD